MVKLSMVDRPIDLANGRKFGFYHATLGDIDLQDHIIEPFTPRSASEILLWDAELRAYARTLGHHAIEINYASLPGYAQKHAWSWKRINGGEWLNSGLAHHIQIAEQL